MPPIMTMARAAACLFPSLPWRDLQPPAGVICWQKWLNLPLCRLSLGGARGGKGYELIIQTAELSVPLDDEATTATWMNALVEQNVLLAPDQYMWLHRRFKTRPEGEPALY